MAQISKGLKIMVNPEATKRRAGAPVKGDQPVVVLVEPQLGENVGMSARAMMNFGLTEMRIVRPKIKWPNEAAIRTASGADLVLDNVVVFDTTAEAVADLHKVAATTARLRDMIKDVQVPRRWAVSAHQAVRNELRCGLLFGPERVGLHNDDLALADTLITVPTNPSFSSINLAQTVLLLAYEWRMEGGADAPEGIFRKGRGGELATQAEIIAFYEHLEDELSKGGFLRVAEKRPRMVRNIRNIFNRIALTSQEVRTLRGIVVSLTEKKWNKLGEK
jgi:tRNA/rRNA methyltransferase